MARVRDAAVPGVRGCRAVRREDRHLADELLRIGGRQRCEGLLGRLSGREQIEAERAIAPLSVRLRRDKTDAWARPQHAGAAVERPRLDGAAELTALRISGDDRVGQGVFARIAALCARFAAWYWSSASGESTSPSVGWLGTRSAAA